MSIVVSMKTHQSIKQIFFLCIPVSRNLHCFRKIKIIFNKLRLINRFRVCKIGTPGRIGLQIESFESVIVISVFIRIYNIVPLAVQRS